MKRENMNQVSPSIFSIVQNSDHPVFQTIEVLLFPTSGLTPKKLFKATFLQIEYL